METILRIGPCSIVSLSLAVMLGCREPKATAPQLQFVDIGFESGLVHPAWCGRVDKPHLLESGGSGLALLDYDGDGDMDLYLVNGWRLEGSEVIEKGANRLYRNRGDGSFEDVTSEAGVGDDGWGCGVAVGDPDGDGDPDMFVTNFGRDVLYLNQGDGRFQRAENAPGIDGWSTGAVFFDSDGDGDQDLFVAAYVDCSLDDVLHAKRSLNWKGDQVMLGPFGLEGKANRFFENQGGGRFVETTERAGLIDVGLYYSFAVIALDLDHDLDLDLYVANDSNPNYLYINDGQGRFEETGLWSGAALDRNGMAQAGMGLASGDVDHDGLADLFVTNFGNDNSTLYRNLGRGSFVDTSSETGVWGPSYKPLSWGTVLADFDLDGYLDLFIANGHIYPQVDRVPGSDTRYDQLNLLLQGQQSGFVDRSSEAGPGLAVRLSSRGLVSGDLDSDGDLDLIISNIDRAPTYLRNDSIRAGHWLMIDAPGAIRLELSADPWSRRIDLARGSSYVSVSDPRCHVGLGAIDRLTSVKAIWSNGRELIREDVKADQLIHMVPED